MENINDWHVELSHPSKSITSATTKASGIQITGSFMLCEDCTLGKAKQWAISEKAVPPPKILGERFFFNISSPSTPTFGGKKHWLLYVDNSSNFNLSCFLKEKSNLVDGMIGLIKNLKNKYNLQVQYLCCDNAGQDIAFQKACKQEELGVDFKYTAPDLPQQNSCVERNFANLFN